MHALNGFVYLEMSHAVWDLPQAGILANKLLHKHFLLHGYYKCADTPGLWKHETRPISFMLVVDNFGIKYDGQEQVYHFISCIKQHYKLTKVWIGGLYCKIKLNWDYTLQTIDILMPGYIKILRQKYKHCMPTKPQHCLYSLSPKQYCKKSAGPSPR
jgi:hypothetical protein